MDFLPESTDRDGVYDMLTVIIDHLTGMVHLVPSRMNYKAKEVAELVFAEVYKYHGLPKKIVSNRDTLFTSIFWSHLHALIGTKLKMSSAYHPETDGLTERSNRTVSAMLRQCVSADQKDWVSRLPFFLNTGRMPRSMIWNSPAKTEYPGVKVFAQRMKLAVISAHDSILLQMVTWSTCQRRIFHSPKVWPKSWSQNTWALIASSRTLRMAVF